MSLKTFIFLRSYVSLSQTVHENYEEKQPQNESDCIKFTPPTEPPVCCQLLCPKAFPIKAPILL